MVVRAIVGLFGDDESKRIFMRKLLEAKLFKEIIPEKFLNNLGVEIIYTKMSRKDLKFNVIFINVSSSLPVSLIKHYMKMVNMVVLFVDSTDPKSLIILSKFIDYLLETEKESYSHKKIVIISSGKNKIYDTLRDLEYASKRYSEELVKYLDRPIRYLRVRELESENALSLAKEILEEISALSA